MHLFCVCAHYILSFALSFLRGIPVSRDLDVLPAPLNVKVQRVIPTAMEVSWDAPQYPGVSGYRVYYHPTPLPGHGSEQSPGDLDGWSSLEIGPYNSAEINGLEPATIYAVRVRAKGFDGRFGNLSDTVWTRRRENGQ
jgi:hypothetical protein